MAMYDLSIDEAKALMWIQEVNAEVDMVKDVLTKTKTALQEEAGSDDIIMQGIRTLRETMDTVWTHMCKAFKEVNADIEQNIRDIANTGRKLAEDVATTKGQIGK